MEIPPNKLLRPYIRCFWGSVFPPSPSGEAENRKPSTLVIPDACMDIVVTVNHSSGRISAAFCGINDAPFFASADNQATLTSTFGIRFYCWAVALFADTSMKEALNAFGDVEQYFRDFSEKLAAALLESPTITGRIAAAENYLLHRLQGSRPVKPNVLNALHLIIKSRGLISVPDLCASLAVSQRQLERLFAEVTGASPKKTADIVRFQMIWQDMICGRSCNFSDLAYRYQFSDQAHFINSFKKFAGQPPLAALQYARS
ncbi:helix-turn-helix domain-containing protein [Dendrosporobacter quercicolus]